MVQKWWIFVAADCTVAVGESCCGNDEIPLDLRVSSLKYNSTVSVLPILP